jgi:hypothetical protein
VSPGLREGAGGTATRGGAVLVEEVRPSALDLHLRGDPEGPRNAGGRVEGADRREGPIRLSRAEERCRGRVDGPAIVPHTEAGTVDDAAD